jgi:hypothetical protein
MSSIAEQVKIVLRNLMGLPPEELLGTHRFQRAGIFQSVVH